MNSKRISFIDVGQGDCILIQHKIDSSIPRSDIYVDTGNGKRNISELSKAKQINIVLTHNHADHVNGIKYLLEDTSKSIDNIYLPLFANEIDMIAQTIINLKGFQYSETAYEVLQYFRDFHQCHLGLKAQIDSVTDKTKVLFLSQGIEIEEGLKCLNPPLYPSELWWVAAVDMITFFEELDRLFVKPFSDKLKTYFSFWFNKHMKYQAYYEEKTSKDVFSESWIDDINKSEDERRIIGANFVLSFLIENIQLFSEFNSIPDLKKAKQLRKAFQETSHDVCVVLMSNIDNQNILLTSDASIHVFERLLREGVSIQSKYLKAPHHGSIKNINRDILNAIQPEVVIISHGNKKFGRSKDSHPNIELLKLLANMNIRVLSTRDIIKENIIVFSKKSQEYFLQRNSIIGID